MLQQAEQERAALAHALRVPRCYDATIGVTLALFVIANALTFAEDSVLSGVLFVAAFLVFVGNGWWQVRRFRRLNGVWLSGMRKGATIPASVAALLIYFGAWLGSAAAARAEAWWLVALLAVVAGVGFVLTSRWWMRLYRKEHRR